MACELILALDVPSREDATPLLRELRGSVKWVKIGLQMFTAYGPDYVREVADQGYHVFLDLKLHDIPNTVAKAVESLATLPIGMLTLHTLGGSEMMRAAVSAQAARRPELLLLGVTVLTSMDGAALAEVGIGTAPADQVSRLARVAVNAGLRGLVCSPLEVTALRSELPAEMQLVTPGVRPGGVATQDQKRVMSPADAARAGSSYIVVGRPILQASDPAAAARDIAQELTAPTP